MLLAETDGADEVDASSARREGDATTHDQAPALRRRPGRAPPPPRCWTPPPRWPRSPAARSRSCPTLRGRTVVNLFYEDSTRTRISFEAAAKRLSRRRDQLLRQGLQRLQGREPQGHRADPAGDGGRRGGDPALRLRRPAPAGQLGRRLGDQRRRRHPRAPDPGAAGRVHDARPGSAGSTGCKVAIVGDVLHSRVARSNVLLLHTLGAQGDAGRAADAAARSGVATPWPGADVCYDLDAVLPGVGRGDDAAGAARADERLVLPVRARVRPPLRPGRRRGCAGCPSTRSSCTPGR